MPSRPRLRSKLLAAAAVLAGIACAPRAAAPPSPAVASDLTARADQAALYALPLVIMDLTRDQFFAGPLGAGAAPDRFVHIPILGNPSFRSVVRPNVDTLYSTAWLELGAEPVLLTVPPSDGRYFMVQCMDAWTNVFAAPGIRTLGNRGAAFAIVGPDWHGQLPAGVEPLRAATRMVWLLARVYVRDRADLDAARAFQRQLELRPASAAASATAIAPPLGAGGARRPIMRDILRDLGAEAFYERFARAMIGNPPAPEDAQFTTAVLAPFGISPGKPLVWSSLDDGNRRALAGGLDRVLRALDGRARLQQRGMTATGWTGMGGALNVGSYGVDYQTRAAVAAVGLGANLRIDAIYLNAGIDGAGQPLDGSKRYRLRFAAGSLPPVRAFWSVTLYDEQGYLVNNPVERYAIKSGDALVHEPDGALVIYLQPDDPGPEHRASWLPTPDHQRFELSLRAYWPDQALLQGQWTPPAVLAVE